LCVTLIFLHKQFINKAVRIIESIIMQNQETSFCHYSGLPSPLAYVQSVKENTTELSQKEIDRIIEMAWEDKTPFDAIEFQFGLNDADVKALMKKELKFSSYKLWRRRVENCKTKHASKRSNGINRFKSSLQRGITNNKISKR
jgi:uncharacterized protein (TIGR03643 family)